MNKENKIKIMGSIIIFILTAFWSSAVSVHPNLFFRIVVFSCGFGFTAYGLTLPLVWLARRECH